MKAVIIAAGFGSRLWQTSHQIPKTLLPLGKGTILSTIIEGLKAAGISELLLVIGFNREHIIRYLEHNPPGLPYTLVENLEWERGNALSVYKVKDYVENEPFLLSMSDHVVSVDALRQIATHPERTNLLMVDPFIMENFDLDDATKVLQQDGYITEIGKELSSYNALDCGIFRLETDFFGAVEQAVAQGKESISAAICELAAQSRIRTIILDKPDQWLDIDTPEAYQHALQNYKGV